MAVAKEGNQIGKRKCAHPQLQAVSSTKIVSDEGTIGISEMP